MLKKITAAILLIAFTLTVLSGCSFITKNEQRDNEQAVAEIRYGGRVAYVTKIELSNLYNQQGFYYIYYYGWTAEETFDQLTKSLSNSALLGLKAKEYLSTLEGVTLTSSTVGIDKPTTEQLIAEMEQLLTDKYIMEAKKETNKTFQEAYDELVKEIEEEKAIDKPEEEKEEEKEEKEEKEETVRPNPPKEDEDEEVIIPDDFFTIKTKELTAADEVGKEAIRRLKKSIGKQFKDYNYYYSNQLLSKVIERYKDEYKKELADPTDAEIEERYNEMLNKNISAFSLKGAYAEALKKDPKPVIYHPGYDIKELKGYFFVKNILLKFSDDQTDLLNKFKEGKVANEEAVKVYRDYLANQIKVNVSNPEFDSEKDESEENQKFARKDVPVNTILDEIKADLNASVTLKEKIEKFVDWTYLVNDDPGMFTNMAEGKPDYLVTPEGEKSDYVEEFTALARGLFQKGEGAYGLNPNELSYCVTDYGIHLIMVSYIPFNYAEKQGTNQVGILEGKNVNTLDAIIDNVKGQTLKEYIFDILKEEKAENAITVVNRDLYIKYKETAVTTYPKVYKDMLKEAKKLEKK